MTSPVTIEPVVTHRLLREFIQFPFTRYRDEPCWVPPFTAERMAFFDRTKNPFFAHARAQLFLARRDGAVVGTVAACVDDNHNTFHHEQQGAFGFFETVDDPQVAAALLYAAETWVRARGMQVIRGPLNFSINHEYGLLVEGFDTPPMVMTTYNPPCYAALIEGCGYRSAMDMYAYLGDLDDRLHNAPPKVFRAAERAVQRAGIRVRSLNKRRYDDDVRLALQVYDQAWQQLWDFVPVTPREADKLAADLKLVLDPDLIFLAETSDGQPVGVSLTLPDLNQALHASGGGRLLPFGLPRFLWHKRRINQARLWALGVVDEYRGRGIDAVFYVETARAALRKGYTHLEGSLILENNVMMNRIIERLGGRKYKTYRIYEKQF